MLQGIKGRLANDIEIKDVKVGENNKQVANATLYIDKGARDRNIPVKISAWDEQAKELAQYKKGDEVHLIGDPKLNAYNRKFDEGMEKPVKDISFTVLHVDHDKTIIPEANEYLKAYMKDNMGIESKLDSKNLNLNVVAGNLARDVEIRNTTIGGSEKQVTSNAIFMHTGKSKDAIPVEITAWDDAAKTLANGEFTKGKAVHAIVSPNLHTYTPDGGNVAHKKLAYTVIGVADKDLSKNMDDLYRGVIDRHKEKTANQQKEKDAPQKEASEKAQKSTRQRAQKQAEVQQKQQKPDGMEMGK